MRQILYIHLRDTAPDALLTCRVDGAATGASRLLPLGDIAALANGARVVVFVPAASVHFLGVDLPVRSRNRALIAAPFACEDQLAEDVDALHFAHLGRSGDQHHRFAVVAHSRMRLWLDRLADAGIVPDVLIPDALCLPEPDDDEWVVLAEARQPVLLVRQSAASAGVIAPATLPMMLQMAGDGAPARVRLLECDTECALPNLGDVQLQRSREFGSLLDILVRGVDAHPEHNLLQARYAPHSRAARHLLPWRVPAALAAGLLLVAFAVQIADTVRLSQQAQQQEAANLERFQELFPGYRNVSIAQIPGFVNAEIRGATEGGRNIGMLALLDSYAQAAQRAGGLQLQGMQWRDRTLLLNLRGESLDNLEALRNWYGDNQHVAMEVENANAGSDSVQIRIRLSARS